MISNLIFQESKNFSIKWSQLMETYKDKEKWQTFHNEACLRVFANDVAKLPQKATDFDADMKRKRKLIEGVTVFNYFGVITFLLTRCFRFADETSRFCRKVWLPAQPGRKLPEVKDIRKAFTDWHYNQRRRGKQNKKEEDDLEEGNAEEEN